MNDLITYFCLMWFILKLLCLETGEICSRKRKLNLLEEDLRFPMERGWKRETVVKGFDQQAKIQGDVTYKAPCGKVLKHIGEVMQVSYLLLV